MPIYTDKCAQSFIASVKPKTITFAARVTATCGCVGVGVGQRWGIRGVVGARGVMQSPLDNNVDVCRLPPTLSCRQTYIAEIMLAPVSLYRRLRDAAARVRGQITRADRVNSVISGLGDNQRGRTPRISDGDARLVSRMR